MKTLFYSFFCRSATCNRHTKTYISTYTGTYILYMAGETTHDSTHAVQLIECSITESLLDVDESSEEIKTCETPKDETIEQENQSEIDININNTDNILALKEPEEVAILEELQNEVGNFRNDPDKTDKRQDTTETMRTQGEDATSTKDKDAEEDNARQEEEVDGFLKNGKVIVAQKAKKNNAMVNQKRNNDSNSSKEDGTIGFPKDEAVDITADDGIKVFEVDTKEQRDFFDQMEALEPCGNFSLHEVAEEHDGKDGVTVEDNARQEEEVDDSSEKEKVIVAQKAKKNHDKVNQKKNNGSKSFNEGGTIGIPINVGVDVKADDGIKVFEVDTMDRMDSFDQIETVESCESPSLNKTAEEHDGRDGATVEVNARHEDIAESSLKNGKVIVAQKAKKNNDMVNQKKNNDSNSFNEEGTVGIPKDEAVDITAVDEIMIFCSQKKETIIAQKMEESNYGINQKQSFSADGKIGIPMDVAVNNTADDGIKVFEEDTKEQRDSFDQIEAMEPCESPSLHKTAEEHDGKDGATVEELDDSSQKEKEVIFVQKVEESNNSEVINKWNEKSVGLIGDGSIVIAKDDNDIDIDSAADDDTNVFEVDTKKGRDSFDQIEESLVEPCGNPSLHDANGTFAISDQDQEAQDVYFSMVITNGDPSSPHAKDAIAENIQQGELLLYRLHHVQQNQELQQVSDGPSASNTAAMATTNITVNSVTLRPGTEGEDDDLPCEVDIIHKNEDQEEVMGTTSAGIGEDNQVVMGKENIWRPLEETPIQREIRHGLEREKSLRRSRGLGDLENKSEELVEIPVMRSPEVFGDQSSGTNVGLNVERRLAKRKMLQDINQEAMKEQGVKKLGKIPGLYEEGYAQELKERRMLFESFHQSKKTDVQGSSKGRKLFSSSFTAKNAETPLVQSLERTRSLDFFTNHHLKDSTCPSAGRESHKNDTDSHKECQIKYLEDDATSASSNETHSVQKSLRPSISSSSLDCSSWTMLSVQDNRKEDEEGSVLKGKNPFFKLRPSLSLRPDVEKEIKEAMEREQELRRLRSRLYGDQWNRSGDQQEEGSTKSSCPEAASTVSSDHVYRGKLTLIWPPPHSKVDEDAGPPKPIGQRSTLQHHWESGMQ
uniref:Enolase-phosphatase E1-like n=1 Tax=Astyanax mexicanus TaxID=7994 RepID=A0A3B1KLB5_ASTMX